MAVKSTIKSKAVIAPKAKEFAAPKKEAESAPKDEKQQAAPAVKTKKVCYFCESKTEPRYTDVVTLRKFMNDRAKIVGKIRSGACSKHQRRITREIKHARHLALLPFVASV